MAYNALCKVHWQLYLSTLIRIPDEACLTRWNSDPSSHLQNVQKYVCSREFVRLIAIRPLSGSDLSIHTCIELCLFTIQKKWFFLQESAFLTFSQEQLQRQVMVSTEYQKLSSFDWRKNSSWRVSICASVDTPFWGLNVHQWWRTLQSYITRND